VVAPNALPPFCQPAGGDEIDSLKRRLGISNRYILALGNLQPRKNITTLMRAWKTVMASPNMQDVTLVITGKKAWLYEEILNEAGPDKAMEDRILFTGYLVEEDLPALYSGALLFVYPSLFEGFGLPPIEAMACGTPVIVGENSALSEVCGQAARYSEVTDPVRLGRDILALSLDEEERRTLSVEGTHRAGSFTLERLTLPTLRAWESIA
jgi:glycosyltransferase involved in cell wall biosynthesis